jgi:hypothetical protein
MNSRFEDYSKDLHDRLQTKLDARRADEIVREVHSHLHESKKARMELDEPEYEAEQRALQAFGPAATLAENVVRREKGYSTRSDWRLALIPALLLVLSFGGMFTPNFTGSVDHLDLFRFLEFGVLASIAFVVWRSRRWIVRPLATTLAVLYVLTFAAFTFLPGQFSSFGLTPEQRIAGYQQQLAENTAKLRRGEFILAGKAKPEPTVEPWGPGYFAPARGVMSNSIALPYVPFPLGSGEQDYYHLSTAKTLAEASEAWKANGSKYLNSLKEVIANDRKGTEEAKNPELQTMAPGYLPMAIAMYAWQILVFVLLNWAILGLARLRDRMQKARDPHLA